MVSIQPSGAPSVSINDLWRNRQVAAWDGYTADRLLESDAIPVAHRRGGIYSCNKETVRRMLLAAAAHCLPEVDADLRLVSLNRRRLRRHREGRSGLHNRVLDLLFGYPSQHFSEQDILCIMALECPSVSAQRVFRCLRDIVDWRLVQRITIDQHNVFFDINTTPHLHVFDPGRRVLLDAPSTGFVTAQAQAQ